MINIQFLGKHSNLRTVIVGACLAIVFLSSEVVIAQSASSNIPTTSQEDESAVKAAVEGFLVALGNGDIEKVRTMFLSNANIASITMKDGKPNIFTVSAEQYLSQREGKETRKFTEPVRNYTVNISQGMLAFVRADATVYYDGKASHHTNDFFVLMKEDDVWKFLSGSYTVEPLVKDK